MFEQVSFTIVESYKNEFVIVIKPRGQNIFMTES